MILHDAQLVRRLWYYEDDCAIGIDPEPDDEQIQPASIDLRLGETVIHPATGECREIPADDGVTILPGAFLLSETLESVSVPNDLLAEMTGRSTLGRKGLVVHATAGLADPGWDGVLTMEMAHLGPDPVTLHPGDRVCQLKFSRLTGESSGYDGQYQGADAAEPAGEL